METLAQRIARDGPVSELDAIGWAIRLAKRLEALHALGVAHGSVSPACILTSGQDRNARAYLADVQHTSPTPAYHSPERIVGGDISVADDVWALAATLYALLTGQSPFAGATDAEVRQKILAASPAPLAVYDVGDDDLQHILDHAFARDIGKRSASVAAFRRALEEWHPDRGVANLPPLEDEDSTDDDDGARTMLVRDSAAHLQSVGLGVPKVNDDDDEDEDNVRTVMREMPKEGMAAILAAAPRPAAGAPPAVPAPPAGVPRPFPMAAPQPRHPGPPRPVVPAPRAPQPAPAPFAAQPAPLAAAPPAAAPLALPQLHDEETEDNIRTVMRTPEEMAAEDSQDLAPRTLMLTEGQEPWRQGPAAGAPLNAGLDGPAPAPTMALPSQFDPSSPQFGAGAGGMQLAPAFAGPQGTQKISEQDLPPMGLGMPGMGAGAPAAAPAPMMAQPFGAPQAPQPLAVPEPQSTSKLGLLVAAVIALLVAAGATFAFLKLRGF